jgi:deoxyribonucleoside regulator
LFKLIRYDKLNLTCSDEKSDKKRVNEGMEQGKNRKIIEAAKLYYLMDYSQQEIASRLGVSRPTVSRMLQQAKEEGIVKIQIMDPSEDMRQLAEQLETGYGLKKAIVVSVPVYDDLLIKEQLAKNAATYLREIVQDEDIIGTTWGTTLYQVARHLEHKPVKGVQVVQLKGGVSHSERNTYASEIIHLFAEAFDAKPYHLPLPAIVDHVVVKQAIEADRHIRRVLDIGKQANIALFTTGGALADSLVFQLGYLSDEDVNKIVEHAVGDISSRFFDREGRICHPELNARTIGIELEDLKQKEHSILISGGARKIEGIKGALRGQYANTLITDQYTAKFLLDNQAERKQ